MLVTAQMTSSLHTHRHINGPPTAFSPNVIPQARRFGPGSMKQNINGGQHGLFPPSPALQSPPSDPPVSNGNIMNRRGDMTSSLYQICLALRRRLAEVPGFEIHIAEMEEEEADANDSTDPVTSMWNCLRRGYPLMTMYNALKPEKPLDADALRVKDHKLAKAATFKFLQACMTDLKFPPNECFLITDLYGGDTTGFVKVSNEQNVCACW